jgi:hypothetical protein
MLQSVNLDDRTYESIMEYVMSELPRLCPSWTDYNEHDPGITILELFAWYKEMQQYHLNTVTDAILKKLFALAGIEPLPERASTALAAVPADCPSLPKFTKLRTVDGVGFELLEPYYASAVLTGVYALGGGDAVYLGDFLDQPNVSAAPFQYGGADTRLLLTLERVTGECVKLYFDVADDYEAPRNPFRDGVQAPRVIRWEFEGIGEFLPDYDETHALSRSGFITFTPPHTGSLRVILTLTDRGCEEDVRLYGVSGVMARAVQCDTLSRCEFVIGAGALAEFTEPDGLATGCFIFARRPDGLEQFTRSVYGGEELAVVNIDPERLDQMIFDSDGLPDMTLPLPAMNMRPLTDKMLLICDTLCGDGVVRPDIWRYTDDLRSAKPRDRVFTLDAGRQNIVFGDGEYGAIVPNGRNAVMLASYAVSYCGGGNVSAGEMMITGVDGVAKGFGASKGRAAESIDGMARRLARRLKGSNKCMSASDYESAALSTPGLRMASAKALVGYDPDEPTGRSGPPAVSVVVKPWSGRADARADGRFLAEVRGRLNRMRPIGVKIKVLSEMPADYKDRGASHE